MIQFFWLVHGLKHLNLWEWTSIWLTNSLVLTFVCSFSTEETWHQFNRILVQYLAVTTHHFHCLSLHQVNSDSSLSMSWVYSSAIFSLSCCICCSSCTNPSSYEHQLFDEGNVSKTVSWSQLYLFGACHTTHLHLQLTFGNRKSSVPGDVTGSSLSPPCSFTSILFSSSQLDRR